MARIGKKILYSIFSFVLSFLVVMAGIFPAILPVSAEETSQSVYEQTNVLDDLKKSTIGDKPFDLTDYNFDESKETKVLSFVEYCYSFYSAKQNNFGLYIYVYNPQGLQFNKYSPLNKIQFAVGSSSSTNYTKYNLKYLNCSTETNYEGLFYKFRIDLTDAQKETILSTVNSTERVYRVSGLELVLSGAMNATEYGVATTYKYSGYAAGYGSNENAASTLVCSTEETDVLSLSVHATQYKPEGTNTSSIYTQDCLHSVYFAVPNKYINKYGAMTAVHAIWKNAVTAPILVTGNASVYSQVSSLLGDYVHGGTIQDEGRNTDLDYALIATKAQIGYRDTVEAAMGGYVAYNVLMDYGGINAYNYYDNLLHYLYYCFYAENGDADNYTLSSQAVLDVLEKSAARYGGVLVNGKYSEKMFSSYDKEFTEVNIKADENFSLTSEVLSQTWWEKLWGLDGSVSETTKFDGIQAIYPVTKSDLQGTDEEISKRLYVDKSDVSDLKDYFNQNNGLSTVYLFRYMQSEYTAYEVTEYKHTTDWALFGGTFNTYEVKDTNAYFAQMSVQLDFDIIDVTFSNGEKDTVIPVVSNPIDVVPDVTPPVYTLPEEEETDWLTILKIVVAVILILALLIFLWPLIKPLLVLVGKGIVWLIQAPFKAIGRAIKKRKRRKEEEENNNGENG